MIWSRYQEDLFTAVRETDDSLVVEAVAGSGKTTSIVEAVRHVPQGKRICFLAFNKAIAETLKQKLNGRAYCATLHSLGLSAWCSYIGARPEVDSRKSWEILKKLVPDWDFRKKLGGVPKLVGLAKQAGLVPEGLARLKGDFLRVSVGEVSESATNACNSPSSPSRSGSIALSDLPEVHAQSCELQGLIDDDDDQWRSLAIEYDIDEDEYDVGICRMLLKSSLLSSREVIDYDDMLYLPVVTGAPFDHYDVVFVDEWQDTNAIQHVMVERMLNGTGGRLIAVGDASQSIYRFRGALSSCMTIARQRFQCKPLPLSISYRCPVRVVEHARQWVKQIEWAEGAKEGLVVDYPSEWHLSDFRPTDVLLCRLNRPLVEVAFRLIRNRIPCHILGRDIAAGLVKLVEKPKLKDHDPIQRFSLWLNDYQRAEVQKLTEEHKKQQLGLLIDKIATVRVFVQSVRTVGELKASIESMFSDRQGGITLSTIHKAKGQEWPRVFVLDADELMPCEWSNDLVGETNLMYVAATRASEELYYLRSKEIL